MIKKSKPAESEKHSILEQKEPLEFILFPYLSLSLISEVKPMPRFYCQQQSLV